MKALLIVAVGLAVAGCDMSKITQVSPPESTPDPTTPGAAGKGKVTPKPTPKPGDWMWDQYKKSP